MSLHCFPVCSFPTSLRGVASDGGPRSRRGSERAPRARPAVARRGNLEIVVHNLARTWVYCYCAGEVGVQYYLGTSR